MTQEIAEIIMEVLPLAMVLGSVFTLLFILLYRVGE